MKYLTYYIYVWGALPNVIPQLSTLYDLWSSKACVKCWAPWIIRGIQAATAPRLAVLVCLNLAKSAWMFTIIAVPNWPDHAGLLPRTDYVLMQGVNGAYCSRRAENNVKILLTSPVCAEDDKLCPLLKRLYWLFSAFVLQFFQHRHYDSCDVIRAGLRTQCPLQPQKPSYSPPL